MRKNQIPPIIMHCLNCNKEYRIFPYRLKKSKFCSRKCADKLKMTDITKKILSLNHKGQVKSPTAYVFPKGSEHPNWKGGRSKNHKIGYYSTEYKEWRKSVFKRDNYTCRCCGKNNIFITAHHIKSFTLYPSFRFDLNNGITLCEECHSHTNNYRGRGRNKAKSEEAVDQVIYLLTLKKQIEDSGIQLGEKDET